MKNFEVFLKMRKRSNKPKYSKWQLQNAFVEALSKPRRRREKYRKPSKIKVSTGVRKAALKGKCTSWVNFLSEPLPRRIKNKNKEKKVPGGVVRKAALRADPTEWNINNALPKLKQVSLTKTRFKKKLPPRQQVATEKIYETLIKKFEENHPSQGESNEKLYNGTVIHKECFADPRDAKQRYLCELSQEERQTYLKRMILMSRPRDEPQPAQPDRGPKKKLDELNLRLEKLASPVIKESLTPREPFKVKPNALKAVCSPYLEQLARHREPRPPAPVYDFRGNEILPPRKWDVEARRRVVASERTEQLATPKRQRVKKSEVVKEDPFGVRPEALTAVCSERLAELAQPIVRD